MTASVLAGHRAQREGVSRGKVYTSHEDVFKEAEYIWPLLSQRNPSRLYISTWPQIILQISLKSDGMFSGAFLLCFFMIR